MNTRTIEELPYDVLLNLTAWFAPEDLFIFSLINHFFLNFYNNEVVWKNKFALHFPQILRQVTFLKKDILNWHNFFWETYSIEYKHLSPYPRRLFSLAKEGFMSASECKSFTFHHHGNTLEDWLKYDNFPIDSLDFPNPHDFPYTFLITELMHEYILLNNLLDFHNKCRTALEDESTRRQYSQLRDGTYFSILRSEAFTNRLNKIISSFRELKARYPDDYSDFYDNIPETMPPSYQYRNLFLTAMNQSLFDIAEAILKEYPDAIEARRSERTALMLAATYNDRYAIEFLINHGADLNAYVDDEWPVTALHFAAMHNQNESIEILLRPGIAHIPPLHLYYKDKNFLPRLFGDTYHSYFSRNSFRNPLTQLDDCPIETENLNEKTINLLRLEEFIQEMKTYTPQASRWFSYFQSTQPSIKQQIQAAIALREVILFGADSDRLQEHEAVLNAGKLGEIYIVLKKHIPEKERALSLTLPSPATTS